MLKNILEAVFVLAVVAGLAMVSIPAALIAFGLAGITIVEVRG